MVGRPAAAPVVFFVFSSFPFFIFLIKTFVPEFFYFLDVNFFFLNFFQFISYKKISQNFLYFFLSLLKVS